MDASSVKIVGFVSYIIMGMMFFVDKHGNEWIICSNDNYSHLIPMPFAKRFMMNKEKPKKGPLTNKEVFNSFGCTGENISPHLSWSNAPSETKSFVITMYDPDAPTGSGWWHWTVFDIPANINELAEGAGDITKNLIF